MSHEKLTNERIVSFHHKNTHNSSSKTNITHSPENVKSFILNIGGINIEFEHRL